MFGTQIQTQTEARRHRAFTASMVALASMAFLSLAGTAAAEPTRLPVSDLVPSVGPVPVGNVITSTCAPDAPKFCFDLPLVELAVCGPPDGLINAISRANPSDPAPTLQADWC